MSKIFLLILMCVVFHISADSIDPESYRGALPVGGSVTINKTLVISKEPPTTAKIDVFFLTDATGSMSSFLSTVRTYAEDIVRETKTLGDVAYGVGSYRNSKAQGNSNPYIFQMETNLSTDDLTVENALNSWTTDGGSGEEDAFYAIKSIADNANWRTGSTRILIWFGDIASKDPSEGVDEADVLAALSSKNIIVEAMNIKTTKPGLNSKGQAQRIADATNGHYYEDPAIESIVTLIKDAIVEVFYEYNKVNLQAFNTGPAISVAFNPASYDGTYDRSIDREFTFTATITKNNDDPITNFTISGLVDGGIAATEYDTIEWLGLPEWPDIVNSSIYDKNGDGIADSILVALDSIVPDKYVLTDALFPWGGDSFNPTLTNANLNATKDTITSTFVNSNDYHTFGKEILQVTMDSLTIPITHSGDLLDKIGPICIDTAILYERFQPGPDTLLVKVSEPIDISLLAGTEFLLRKGGVEHLLTLTAPATNPNGASTDVYFTCTDLGINAPAEGDSLRVNPGGVMVDLEGNSVHVDNIAVPIKLDRQAISPVASATLFDADANGHGDSLLVTFTTALNASLFSECVLEYPKGSGDIVTIPASSITPISTTEYAINGFSMANLVTSGLGDLTIKFDSLGTPVERIADVQDGIAPVVISAAMVDSIKTGAADILTVTYSEEIQPVTATEPSQMKELATSTPYRADVSVLSQVGTVVQYTVNAVVGPTKIVQGDSLHCNAGATPLITDLIGNVQDNDGNRFCEIHVATVGILSYKLLDGSNMVVDTVVTNDHASIEVIFEAASLTSGLDIVNCVLTTADGDSETITLVEDAAQQGIYTAQLSIGHNSSFTVANDILEGVYVDPYTADTTSSKGTLTFMGYTIEAPLALLYNAEIYDEPSKISVHNVPADVKVSLLTHLDTECKIYLDTYSKTTETTFDITVQSAVHKDKETVTLLLTDAVAGNLDTLRLIMGKIVPHSCSDIVAPTASNGILETTSKDTLFLSWTNPLNPTDEAFDTVVIQGEASVVGVQSALISDENEDGRADLIRVHFDAPTPIDFAMQGAYWNSVDPMHLRAPDVVTKVSATEYTYAFTTNSFGEDLTGIPAGMLAEALPRLIFNPGQEYPVVDSVNIADRVGVVPTVATLFEAEAGSGKPDTLQVHFSEKILETGPAMGSLTRLVPAGGDDTLIYATSIAVDLEGGTTVAIAVDGLSATILTPHQPRNYYLDKRLFLDTTLAYDLLNNRASRKSVPIAHRGALFFTKVGDNVPAGSFKSEENSAVTAHLYSRSITTGIDNASLSITSLDGESETFTMVESNTVSGYYTANVPVSYAPSLAVGNAQLEGVIVSPVENDTTPFVSSVKLAERTYAGGFDLTYRGENDLFVKNSLKTVTNSVTHEDTTLFICFNSDLTIQQPTYTVTVESAIHKDVEEIVLESTLNGDPDFVHNERFQLAKGVKHICSSILKPTSANGIIETSAADTLFLQWINPLEPTEILKDTVLVEGETSVVGVQSAQISDENEDGRADLIRVHFDAPAPIDFAMQGAYWNSVDPLHLRAPDLITKVTATEYTYAFTTNSFGVDLTGIPAGTLAEALPRLIFSPNQEYPVIDSVNIQDRVGIVPRAATLFEAEAGSGKPDTLQVYFSEEILETGPAMGSLTRLAPTGGDDTLIYATSIAVDLEVGTAVTIAADGLSATILTPHQPRDFYLDKRLFLDTTLAFDRLNNRASRKGVSITHRGALFFTKVGDPVPAGSFKSEENTHITAHLYAKSVTAGIDNAEMTITSLDGESETLLMVESSTIPGYYTTDISVSYAPLLVAQNMHVEGVIDSPVANDTTAFECNATLADRTYAGGFDLTYRGENDLFVKNSLKTVTNSVTHEDTTLFVCFNSDLTVQQPTYTVTVESAVHKDVEEVVLESALNGDPDFTHSERFQLAKGVKHICSSILKPTSANGIIETSAEDTLFFQWINPLNNTEVLRDTVFVTGDSESMHVNSAKVYDRDENGVLDVVSVAFAAPLPMLFTADQVLWPTADINGAITIDSAVQIGTHQIDYYVTGTAGQLDVTAIPAGTPVDQHPKIIFTAGQTFPVITSALIEDGMGVVPVQAKVFEAEAGSGKPDTLQVLFSEEILARGTALGSLTRLAEAGGDDTLIYATSIPVDLEAGSEAILAVDGLSAKILTPHKPREYYLSKRLFLDTTLAFDKLSNRASRKSVAITHSGALFFTKVNDPVPTGSFKSEENSYITAHLYASSITAGIDNALLTITSLDGESETLTMIESSTIPGYYTSNVSVSYVPLLIADNKHVEGVIVSPVENDTTSFVTSAKLADRIYAGGFDLTYRGKKDLFLKNSLKTVTKSVTHLDTTLFVCLNSDQTELQPTYTVRVESAVHKDVEDVVLESALNGDPDFAHTERFQLAKGVKHICSSILKPTSANGIIETSATDSLFLQWVNPLDPTEILSDTIVVTGVAQSVNVSLAKVYDRDENGVLDVVSAIFDAPLPMLFTADQVLWPTADITGAITIDSAVQVGTHQIDYYVTGSAGQLDLTAIPVGIESEQLPKINFTPGQVYPVVTSASIQDGMGLVPVQATVKASGYYSTEPDTLTTWLSEALLSTVTSATPPLRKVVSGADHIAMYAGSLPLPFVPGNTVSISPDKTVITQLLAKSDVTQYRNHHIFVDTLTGADVVLNRSARKGTPLAFEGGLYFSEQVSGTIANSFNVQSSGTLALIAHLQTVSPTEQIDKLQITITSVEGESETLELVETAPLSGDFNALVPVFYGTTLTAQNGVVEAVYDNLFSNDTTLFTATVAVNGGARTEQFTLTYIGQNELFAKNALMVRTRLFTDADSLFYTCFNSDVKNALPEYSVSVRTSTHGDQEVVLLNATTDIDVSTINTERVQLIKGLPFISSDVHRPVASNGVIETSADDTLFLNWVHPQNPLIYCADTILVQGTPIVFAPLKATMLDTNENGLVDALIMEYNNPIPEAFLLQDLYWNSQNVLPVTPLVTETITGTACKVTFTERADLLNKTGVDVLATPELAPVVNVAPQDFFKFSALQAVISDGVGAVPMDAKVLRSHRVSVEPDTLVVKVSEALSSVVKSNLIRTCLATDILNPASPISGYEASLELASLSPAAELFYSVDSTIVLLVSKDNPQLQSGNSLFLNQTSTFVDAAGVAPARKRIAIKSYAKLFFSYPEVPDSALQFAEWPNYTTVLMTLQAESNTALVEQMSVTLTTEFGDTETIILTETGPLTGCFTGQVAFTFTTAVVPESGLIEGIYSDIDMNIINTITCNAVTPDGITSVSVLPLHYNAPPRVMSAHYFSASIDTDLPDTLVVTSNVAVSWPTVDVPTISEIFDYWNGVEALSDISVASVLDQNTVGTLMQARILVPREMALTPDMDSIRFYPNSIQIQTAEKVHPQLSNYVPITFGSAPEISIDIVPSPFVPGLSVVPELFRSYIPNAPLHGCGLRVRSRVKIARVHYTILDAVNNVVVEDIPLYGDPSMNRYYGAWSGENSFGRAVGKSTYLVLFVVEDITGEVYKAEKLVGVKEPYVPRWNMPWE